MKKLTLLDLLTLIIGLSSCDPSEDEVCSQVESGSLGFLEYFYLLDNNNLVFEYDSSGTVFNDTLAFSTSTPYASIIGGDECSMGYRNAASHSSSRYGSGDFALEGIYTNGEWNIQNASSDLKFASGEQLAFYPFAKDQTIENSTIDSLGAITVPAGTFYNTVFISIDQPINGDVYLTTISLSQKIGVTSFKLSTGEEWKLKATF